MSQNTTDLGAAGILIPVPTPFAEDWSVDIAAYERLLDFYLAQKIGGLFVLGSYGMGPALSLEERRDLAERTIRRVAGRLPVIIHTGTADSASTLGLSRHAAELGCAALAIIPPYYYRHSDEEVRRHFQLVADAVALPLVLYDNPDFCGYSFTPGAFTALIKACPSLRGIKVAYGDGDAMFALAQRGGAGFRVYSGWPSFIRARADFGVSGVINPTTTAIPEVLQVLWDADPASPLAERLQRRVNAFMMVMMELGKRLGRGAQAAALNCRGLGVRRYPRWPVPDIPAPDQALLQREVDAILQEIGVAARRPLAAQSR
jgi:dihydrodipicolinate synthase/N-acetylneuraminate lyase